MKIKILAFLKSAFCWLVGGCKIALTADERMTICKKCVHYVKGRCSICGCILTAKTKMDTEKCPIDKW